jgi:acyl-coenzyme A thioesterase 9
MLSSHIKKNQDELEKHRMHESYAEALIPLGDQPHLRNKYANFMKAVRIGRLLEDLDTMAGKFTF